MKKARKMFGCVLISVMALSAVSINAFAEEMMTLENIYVAGDYNAGSIYGPQLNQTELSQVAEAVRTFVESYDWEQVDDYTKAGYANEYLCNVCNYAPDWSQNRANTAWGALVYGEAQCSGYARAFKALCDAIGLGCYYVHADENASNPSHQWNEVCVDGAWYIIDVQCNDSSDYPSVFLISGDSYARRFGMSWNHDGLPECTKDYSGIKQNVIYDVDGGYRIIEHDSVTGYWLRTSLYNADGTLKRFVMNEYDENGNRVKELNCNGDGIITYYTFYEYGGNGNLVKKIECRGNGNLHHVQEFDAKGRCVSEISYNEDGTLDIHWVREYNEDGTCLREIEYHDDGTYQIMEYAGKHVIQTIYNANGAVASKLDFNFENGSVTVLTGDIGVYYAISVCP